MSIGLILQAIVVGLAAGAVTGLVAMGFALVFRLTGVLQLAHGDLVGAASFGLIAIIFGSGAPVAGGIRALPYALAVIVVLLCTAAAGAAIYRIAVRPSIGDPIMWIGATAAIAFAIEGTLAAVFRREAYALPDPFPFSRARPIALPGGAQVAPRVLIVLAIGVAVAIAARALLRRGSFGAALSAIASEPIAARLAGLPVERHLTIAFALAGALAGLAGVIGAPDAGSVGVLTGAVFGSKAIAAAIVGGLVDLDRVYVAALGLGVLESGVATLLPHGAGVAWRDITPLLAAVILLIFRSPKAAMEDIG